MCTYVRFKYASFYRRTAKTYGKFSTRRSSNFFVAFVGSLFCFLKFSNPGTLIIWFFSSLYLPWLPFLAKPVARSSTVSGYYSFKCCFFLLFSHQKVTYQAWREAMPISIWLKKKPSVVCALKISTILRKETELSVSARHLRSKMLNGSGTFNMPCLSRQVLNLSLICHRDNLV